MQPVEYRMTLNNWAQANKKEICWETFTSGAAHAPVWTAVVVIDSEYSRADGKTLGSAKEEAARKALQVIESLEQQ
ncbi:hypothetical protein D9758_014862 [Tetrapyrgos nigripes]|uniref:DRBM domain-containing protein n=1 Tax=Tetrapyrgos nigripes TaxID=182062 RepID=A0A8H5CTF5_9AGAR|nr:hypothetical protein D9758_014862 [Tetrapyrgos nigripes]